MNDWPEEETDNPLLANDRNYYKVEKWTKDGTKVDRLLYVGNNLKKARELFAAAIKHRPRIRLTIRQRRGTISAASGRYVVRLLSPLELLQLERQADEHATKEERKPGDRPDKR